MKILKRLLIVILLIPAVFFVGIEFPFYTIRWIITGIRFPDCPLLFYILEGDIKSYFKKPIPFIFLFLTVSINCFAQISFSTKTSYKFNKEDGWVRIVESEWFTINADGDTTHWTETHSDTQQEDPGVKADTAPALIPSSVFTVGRPVDTILKLTEDTLRIQLANGATVSSIKNIREPIMDFAPIYTYTKITEKPLVRNIVKWKHHTKYKTRWRSKRDKPVKEIIAKSKPELPYKPINIITYKKKLWCVLSKSGEVYVVEANTKKGAISKLSTEVLSVTQFSDYSILR